MKDKTFWQWSATVAFFIGCLFQLVGLISNSLLPLIVMFSLWGYALWCVAYRTIKANNNVDNDL